MDQALVTVQAVAEAALIAGTLGVWLAILQERLLGRRLEGEQARLASIAAALIVGIVATVRVGGFVVVGDPSEPIGLAGSILASAGVVLAASQMAFRTLVRPVSSGY